LDQTSVQVPVEDSAATDADASIMSVLGVGWIRKAHNSSVPEGT